MDDDFGREMESMVKGICLIHAVRLTNWSKFWRSLKDNFSVLKRQIFPIINNKFKRDLLISDILNDIIHLSEDEIEKYFKWAKELQTLHFEECGAPICTATPLLTRPVVEAY